MSANIHFGSITATTISGGGIYIGKNIMCGKDSFTKSNTGISNGNHSPIKNSVVILNDRDGMDAWVIDVY